MTPTGWQVSGAGPVAGLVALSGPVDAALVRRGEAVLADWGFKVVRASNCVRQTAYLAGSDDERLAGLCEVLDAGARLLLPVRGGYGVNRLLHRMPWTRLVEQGVVMVGYSDLTPVLNWLPQIGGCCQIHGPMVSDLGADPDSTERVRKLLVEPEPPEPLFRFDRRQVLREGLGAGRLMGGNLSLLASLAGTPWQLDLRGAILMVEDVNEPPFRIDRLLTQLWASGMFRGLKGLILGDLYDLESLEEDTSNMLTDHLLELVPEGPVVRGLAFGHTALNLAAPIGAGIQVDTRSGEVRLGA